MHHLRSRISATRFKLASWLLLLIWLVIPASLGVLIYSFHVADKQLAHLALWFFVGAVLLGIIQWALSSQSHCPLCLAHPIARRGCCKHRNAKQFLGSYRLRVACTIIFMNYFRCPYCGEATAVEARPGSSRYRRQS